MRQHCGSAMTQCTARPRTQLASKANNPTLWGWAACPPPPGLASASQDRAYRNTGVGRDTLPAAIRPCAGDLDEAALAMHDHRTIVDRHHLAKLLPLNFGERARDALRRVEHEQLLAIRRGPRARCRIAAADQVEDDVNM